MNISVGCVSSLSGCSVNQYIAARQLFMTSNLSVRPSYKHEVRFLRRGRTIVFLALSLRRLKNWLLLRLGAQRCYRAFAPRAFALRAYLLSANLITARWRMTLVPNRRARGQRTTGATTLRGRTRALGGIFSSPLDLDLISRQYGRGSTRGEISSPLTDIKASAHAQKSLTSCYLRT